MDKAAMIAAGTALAATALKAIDAANSDDYAAATKYLGEARSRVDQYFADWDAAAASDPPDA